MVDFDEQCTDIVIKQTDWDTSKVPDKLRRDIEEYSMSIRIEKLSELTAVYEKQLTDSLSGPVESLFDAVGVDTWASSIRKIYRQEIAFSTSLSGFELVDAQSDTMIVNLKDYARSIIEKKCREEAGKVLMHMKDRFSTIFNHDKDSMPRAWTGKENVRKVTKEARDAALKLLAALAAIRLDEKTDKIESILSSTLTDAPTSKGREIAANTDPLASSSWEEEAHRRGNSWLPPPWAIAMIAILGFNEFMVLLKYEDQVDAATVKAMIEVKKQYAAWMPMFYKKYPESHSLIRNSNEAQAVDFRKENMILHQSFSSLLVAVE